ncbi:MAG: flagellar export chaperone FliS, partial [Thermodesulfovibrionales bacterium]
MTTYSEDFYPHVLVNVSTTPLDLIILLHDSAIESLQRAILYINKGDESEKIKHISKAIAIIEELLISLDLNEGGSVAFSLQRVYSYLLRELAMANIRADVRRIRYVKDIIKELKKAWRQVQ